jgi:hypothetical protein
MGWVVKIHYFKGIAVYETQTFKRRGPLVAMGMVVALVCGPATAVATTASITNTLFTAL